MTTVTQLQLVAPSQLSSTTAVIYTAPSLTTIKIGRAVLCNTSTIAASVTFAITVNSGTLTAANTVISARSIAPGEAYVSPELAGAVIPAGSEIQGFASSTGTPTVTFTLSGISIV